MDALSLFALGSSRPLGERIALRLGVALAPHEERDFEDGEHKVRPLASVRGHDAYVLCSLHGEAARHVDEKLCRLIFFLGALRDASAARVTALVPYLCYARKDRKTKPRDPLTLRYVAALFEAVGADRVVTLDVHDLAAFQNAFRCRTEHLTARDLFVDAVARRLEPGPVCVVSPDFGGIKRAEAFRRALERATAREIAGGFMEKHRSAGELSGTALHAPVRDCQVLIYDDLVSTGQTLQRAGRAARLAGARGVVAIATHGLFGAESGAALAEPALDRCLVTDSIEPLRIDPALSAAKVDVVGTADRWADVVAALRRNGSLSAWSGFD